MPLAEEQSTVRVITSLGQWLLVRWKMQHWFLPSLFQLKLSTSRRWSIGPVHSGRKCKGRLIVVIGCYAGTNSSFGTSILLQHWEGVGLAVGYHVRWLQCYYYYQHMFSYPTEFDIPKTLYYYRKGPYISVQTGTPYCCVTRSNKRNPRRRVGNEPAPLLDAWKTRRG